ncbi:hypothetical protein NSQ59_27295 [Margalitia sp. FSL K6-0131]|uniref:hypothetical protein n=1 Tax=Margalitia sp. FSL K6-0131 TaxID=2954604 RepID=UPI0030F99B4F
MEVLKYLVLLLICLTVLIISTIVGKQIYVQGLPGIKRIRKNTAINENRAFSIKDKWYNFIKKMFPESMYKKFENLLYQTGRHKESWTVEQVINYMLLILISMCLITVIFIKIAQNNPIMIVISIILTIMSPFMLIILTFMKRKEYIQRILYETPELIDVLEKEMVNGSGNPFHALEKAAEETTGDLKIILVDVNKELEKDKGNLIKGLQLLKTRINHSIYDQISMALSSGYDSGKYQKMFTLLHNNTRTITTEMIKKQTAEKNVLLACFSLGLLINFMMLFSIPILIQMLGQLTIFGGN